MSAARVVLRYSDGGMLVEQDGEYVVIEAVGMAHEPSAPPMQSREPRRSKADGATKACPECGKKFRARGNKFRCSAECTNRAARAAYKARHGLGAHREKVGLWTVLSRTEGRGNGKTYWLCRCECGKEQEVLAALLSRAKRGLRDTTSGGCKECTHKLRGAP